MPKVTIVLRDVVAKDGSPAFARDVTVDYEGQPGDADATPALLAGLTLMRQIDAGITAREIQFYCAAEIAAITERDQLARSEEPTETPVEVVGAPDEASSAESPSEPALRLVSTH